MKFFTWISDMLSGKPGSPSSTRFRFLINGIVWTLVICFVVVYRTIKDGVVADIPLTLAGIYLAIEGIDATGKLLHSKLVENHSAPAGDQK